MVLEASVGQDVIAGAGFGNLRMWWLEMGRRWCDSHILLNQEMCWAASTLRRIAGCVGLINWRASTTG
ncbi:unnamed protein product [Rhodiola kirilowii]